MVASHTSPGPICGKMFLKHSTALLLETSQLLGGTWVAQSVKHPPLDFGSGLDLTIREFKPRMGLHAGSVEPSWDSLSPSLSALPPLVLSLSK